MATALISAFTRREIRREVAMTGEITLRGRVLGVGGIKEKVLGAYRAGTHTVILPKQNERDVAEVPIQVKRKIRFLYVEHMDAVLTEALLPTSEKAEKKPRRNNKQNQQVNSTSEEASEEAIAS
jgi:ATP-dependent Lon protease